MKKVLALVLAALLVLIVCSALAEAKAGGGLYIGAVYKQSGTPYFQASINGFQKAADELGFTFDHDGSNDGQIRIIENYINQGVHALINDDIAGEQGDTFTAGDMDEITNKQDDDGGNTIFLDKLSAFNTETAGDFIDWL